MQASIHKAHVGTAPRVLQGLPWRSACICVPMHTQPPRHSHHILEEPPQVNLTLGGRLRPKSHAAPSPHNTLAQMLRCPPPLPIPL